MSRYFLRDDFKEADPLIGQTPYWAIGIVRLENQITASRKAEKKNGDRALHLNPVEERGEPVVLTSSVLQMSVASAKESHVINLNATLAPTTNYSNLIHSGDWVVATIVNDEDLGKKVAQAMVKKEPINQWHQGLKFLGRVVGIHKNFSVSPQGHRQVSFDLQCVGFRELDSFLYYCPQLAFDDKTPAALAKFGMTIRDITNGTEASYVSGQVDINLVIPRLLQAIFGDGPWKKAAGGAGAAASPNQNYLIPKTVGLWLGTQAQTYDQCLVPLLGIHHYKTVRATNSTGHAQPWELFQPDGINIKPDRPGAVFTNKDLIGFFPLAAPEGQISVWSVLSNYFNTPLNECYVTLRADEQGRILPHMILRQTPYNSADVESIIATTGDPFKELWQEEEQAEQDAEDKKKKKNKKKKSHPKEQPNENNSVDAPDYTDFLELPRWVVDPTMVYDGRLGRSDVLRCNFVHISTSRLGEPSQTVDPRNFVYAPPIHDSVDISRNGLMPYIGGVNSGITDFTKGPKLYRDLMADIMMGQHLLLSGSLTTVGIDRPIAVGDNLEFGESVFHIESLVHTASISANGQRTFRTSFNLSHGVLADDGMGKLSSREDQYLGLDDSDVDIGGDQDFVTKD